MMMFEEMGFCGDLDFFSAPLKKVVALQNWIEPDSVVDDDYSDEEIDVHDQFYLLSLYSMFDVPEPKEKWSYNYTLLYRSRNCEFLFRASAIGESTMFYVREFLPEHTCPIKDKIYPKLDATSKLIGGIVKPKFKCHKRKYSLSDIKSDIKEDMGMDLTYIMCWRAKEQAPENLRGKPSASYGKLPAYIHVLNTSYPGSHIKMKKNANNEFLYMFVALTAFIQRFDHCRPIIVVDASHLKGLYTDTFVAVCTMDGADVFYTMAKSYLKTEFHMLMEKVEAVDARMKNYLELVIPASEFIYTVHDKEKYFIVCLKEKISSCNVFQLDEIPCVHACAVLDSKNFKKGPYCSDLYKPKTVLRTYDLSIYPLPHKDDCVIPKEIMDEVVLPSKIQVKDLQRRTVENPDEICMERREKIIVVHVD
ncbi:putative AT-rich interactive domain-containing protein 1-like [Capsicum annuum]|nr:putative AT-rich interactive domain-containing protein 1-like [Capsicum annuum]